MNEKIKPIFEEIIPKIESKEIKYWIYGGIGYAAMIGKFYRSNPDVDLFVLDSDFERLEIFLTNLCKENLWKICKTFISSGRPKIEVVINGRERFSVIPVYMTDKNVKFKFAEGSKKYSIEVLTQVERRLEGYKFTTPKDNFLKTLLKDYFLSKNNYPKKRIEDAKHILTKEEVESLNNLTPEEIKIIELG